MSKDKNNNSNLKRRWLNIGPGIIIALAISALIGSQWIKTELATRKQHNAPPIIERQVVSSSYEEKLGLTPEVKFIIERQSKVELTSVQLVKLNALQLKWEKFYNPRITQANKAAANTREYLDNTKGKSRTPVAQIQSEAAPLVALSGEISSARHSYWNQANKILTSKQRAMVQKEREASWKAIQHK